jgi:hypothetical protein
MCILTSNSIEDKARVIVKSMLLQFQLVNTSETILSQEPLDGLNYVQLGLHRERERERKNYSTPV